MTIEDKIDELGTAIIDMVDRKVVNKLGDYYTKAETEGLVDDTLQDLTGVLGGDPGESSDLGFALNDLSNLNAEGQVILDNKLNKSQVTNCILEAPHMVDVELNDGTLTLKAGSKVIIPYGTSAPTMAIGDSLNGGTIVDISWDGSKLFYIVEYASDIILHEGTYSGTNQYGVGLTPAKDPTRVELSNMISGATDTLTGQNRVWYNTTNNICSFISSSSTKIEYCSLPFTIYQRSNGNATSINQIFQHIGYIGNEIWMMKGTKLLLTNGINKTTGQYTSEEITTQKVFIGYANDTGNDASPVHFYTVDGVNYDLGDSPKGTVEINTLSQISSYMYTLCFVKDIGKFAYTDGNLTIFNSLAVIGTLIRTNQKIDKMVIKSPFQAMDKNDIKSTLVESYMSGTSWYRLYSDGWCEQGGQTGNVSGGATITTTFLKSFSDTNYCIVFSAIGSYTPQGEAESTITTKNTHNFIITSGRIATQPYSWRAEGYII